LETQNGTREQTKNKKNSVSVTLKRVFKNKTKKLLLVGGLWIHITIFKIPFGKTGHNK
jgi:hypothetical protein